MHVLRIGDAGIPSPSPLETCQRRGFCGPFVNQRYYDALPGCHGRGDCVICGRTRNVARQRALRQGQRD